MLRFNFKIHCKNLTGFVAAVEPLKFSLTLFSIYTHFNTLKNKALGKLVGKGVKRLKIWDSLKMMY